MVSVRIIVLHLCRRKILSLGEDEESLPSPKVQLEDEPRDILIVYIWIELMRIECAFTPNIFSHCVYAYFTLLEPNSEPLL